MARSGQAAAQPMHAYGFLRFVLLLAVALLIYGTIAPRDAMAAGTCSFDFGTVAYSSTGNTYVMSPTQNAAVFAACDPRYPAADSGVAAPNNGSSIGGGVWSAVTNTNDNTVTFSPFARFAGSDTFTMYFCGDPNCSGAGRLTATVSVTVAAPTLSLGPASLPDGTVAVAYAPTTLTASGGASPYAFSVVGGTLPPGLSLGTVVNPNSRTSTVELSGTPTGGGTYNFTIRATDNSIGDGPFTVDQAYTVAIAPPTVTVDTASVPDGTRGTAYGPVTLTASGGTAPRTFSVSSGSLPNGMSLSTSGVLSGTPTQAGSFTFEARAQDSSTGSGPYSGARPYTFSIAEIAAVANPVSATVAYGSGNNPITLNVTGGTPTSVAIGTQAVNGTATATGTSITYTPTAGYAGPDSFTYTATNAAGTSAPATVTVTVGAPTMALGPASLPNGTTGLAYNQAVTASGGTTPYTYSISVGSLPAGLSIGTTTGAISGTPTGSGTSNFTVRAQDNSTGPSAPFAVTRPYSIEIVPPNPPVANSVSTTVAYGSTSNPVTLNISGGAPTSVAVATQATNGTATASGTSITYTPDTAYSGPDSFTYTATNADGTSAPATVTITVNPQPPTAGAVSATVAFGSSNNPIPLAITGGTPTSVAVAGGAANGTATASGTTISYTPDTGFSGPDSFTYTATNAGGTSAPATVTITVNPAAPVANAVSATVAANSSGNPITLSMTGGAPASVATPTLPTNGTVSVAGTSITYTPTAGYSGTDSFTYTATNATSTSAAATVSITVTPPTLSLAAIASSGTASTPYSATIVSSLGTAPYDFDQSGGTLPPGLTLQGDGTLAGTPTTPGSFTFDVTATDTHGATGTQSYTIVIAAPTISITAPAAGALPGVAGGGTYSQAFTATGGAGAHQFTVTAGTLPTGLTFSGGVLSGTPTASGTFNFTVTPSDSSPAPGPFSGTSRSYSITVVDPSISITPASLPAATTAQAYSQSLSANGGTAPYDYTLDSGTLPTGLTLSGGVLSGTPTASGNYNFTIEVSDAYGFTGSNAYTITVGDPTVAITGPGAGALPDATGGTAYSGVTVTATGGTSPHIIEVASGTLPAGMSLSAAGVLSGTPTAAGTFNFAVTARDSSPAPGPFTSAPIAYSLTVAAPSISFTPASLPAVATAQTYSQTFSATGGTAPYGYNVAAGTLPAGLTLSVAGVLSGTPTTAGPYNFTIEVRDAHGFTATNAYALTISDPTVTITGPASGALPAATGGTAYADVTITATGGIGPHSFDLAGGTLPTGMTLSTAGVLSGTPTSAGTFNFTVTAEDSSPAPGPFTSAPIAYSLAVAAPTVSFTPASLPAAATAQAYSQTFSGIGGTAPYGYTVAAGALPTGLSLSAAGVLSGTPTAAGTYSFTIEVSDANSFTASNSYSVTVSDPAVAISSPAAGALPAAKAGTPYSQTFTATGGLGAHSFSLAGGALPVGMSLSAAGVLSGTPTTSGSYSFTLAAADSSPAPGPFISPPVAYTLVIEPPAVLLPPSGGLPETPADGAFSYTFTASGGIGPYQFKLAGGTLPPGLSLSPTGVLSGTPTAPGTYVFSITALDSSPPPGPYSSLPKAYKLVILIKDTKPPVFATFPGNIATEVDYPATGAVARWATPTASDDRPGVTVTQTSGPASGSTFPIGATTIGYEARDAAGNSTSRNFTVTVAQRRPGRVTFIVKSNPDGTFGFSATEPALNFAITTAAGSGTEGPISVPAGEYKLAFTVPEGFAVGKADCGETVSKLDPVSLSGTIVVAAGAELTCTITAGDISKTTALIGNFLAARSQLILGNEPDSDRRIERLTGAYTGQGGVSGFGLGFTNDRLPVALRFSEREASFAYSLRRSQVEAKADDRVAAAHGKVRGSLAAKTEEGDPSQLAALERSDAGRPSPFESLHGLAPDAPVPDADPMATRFDIWAEGKLARFDANGGDGNFGILHAGVDYLVTPRLLIGLGLQVDVTDMDGADRSTIDGTGYLVGPYVTARLTEQLYFDARAAWGRSSNSVSPFGTYSDKFDATRWLVSGALIGRYDIERWRIEPSARLAYFEEETDAYLDSFGLPIPQISIETGVFDFGPKLGYQMELDNGWRLEPFVTLQGIWTFRQKNTGTAATESPGLSGTGLRGRGELGLTVSGAASFSASMFYDGVGNEDFQSWGGELRLSRPF